MSKLIVLLGATGTVGGAIVQAFVKDPSFKVRAIVRDVSSVKAQALREKSVELVQGDLNDQSSLERGFAGANYIYAMSSDVAVVGPSLLANGHPPEDILEEAYRIDVANGKKIVNAAAAAAAAAQTARDTLQLLVYSGASAAKELSKGRYDMIYQFDGKADVMKYLQSTYPGLAKKTAELQLGAFATNWQQPNPFRPTKQQDGRYRIMMPCSANTPIPFIDPNHDPAIFVRALVSQASSLPPTLPSPSGTDIHVFAGYRQMTTMAEWTALLNKHLPVDIYFEECSIDHWAAQITFVPGLGLELAQMYHYFQTVGYFGGDGGGSRPITELKLEGELATMEDYVKNEDWSSLWQ